MHLPYRRSIRLQGFDYSRNGAYFVTAKVRNKQIVLSLIQNDMLHLTAAGDAALTCIEGLSAHYPHVILDAFVIMPDHVHFIVFLESRPGQTVRHGLPEIVRAFKSFSARDINALSGTQGQPFWQRNYFERIIRDEQSLDTIRKYITNNPLRSTSPN